ncbi:MAG: prepilin-type N-terminal cleavage/methylation domain-containing protein, partial [Bacilli bacterium]|nr:prepilin-type N-terminal cleavage/methylation domain-containing protein [Bacilli bacterium]
MKKNGFTLIELLGVITIIVIISLIMVPIVDKNIKKTKKEIQNLQIENIRVAGMNYFTDRPSSRPLSDGYSFVKVSKLVELGYLDGSVVDPKDGNVFEDADFVQLFNDSGMLVYTVCPIEEGCEEYDEAGILPGATITKVKDINPGVICGNG